MSFSESHDSLMGDVKDAISHVSLENEAHVD